MGRYHACAVPDGFPELEGRSFSAMTAAGLPARLFLTRRRFMQALGVVGVLGVAACSQEEEVRLRSAPASGWVDPPEVLTAGPLDPDIAERGVQETLKVDLADISLGSTPVR